MSHSSSIPIHPRMISHEHSLDIVVLGAGVIGMTTAVLLQRAGHHVHIVAGDVAPNIVSSNAGAWWWGRFDDGIDGCMDAYAAWTTVSYVVFSRLVDHVPSSGCRKRHGSRQFERKQVLLPWWSDVVQEFDRVSVDELAPGMVDGFKFTSIFVDMSVYMDWLLQVYLQDGGKCITKQHVTDFDSFVMDCGADVVINCTGLGARSLMKDELVYPIRGQTLLVHAPLISEFAGGPIEAMDNDGACYVLPRTGGKVIVGGTVQINDWETKPREEDSHAIWRRAINVVPALSGAKILSTDVGLRPARAGGIPRLEVEWRCYGKKPVIHNYGHGSAGVMMSWGCARNVVSLATKLAIKMKQKTKKQIVASHL